MSEFELVLREVEVLALAIEAECDKLAIEAIILNDDKGEKL